MSRVMALLVGCILVLLPACGGDGEVDALPSVAEEPLPAPTSDVVLTIVGADRPNVAEEVEVDIAGIETLGTTTIEIFEPFISQQQTFTGVDFAQLLTAAGVDPDAVLVMTALDDYEVRFTLREAAAEDVMLATRLNGEAIEIADGGPIRLVVPSDEGPLGSDTNQWIWSLHHIEVE